MASSADAGGGSSAVNLIGHSAGGWLARVFLNEFATDAQREAVHTLITLGTPHSAPPPGVFDQTRGLMRYVNTRYPPAPAAVEDGAAERDDGDESREQHCRWTRTCVCVAGKAVKGRPKGGGFESWLAYNSYRPVCGEGDVWGDGITPVQSALLGGGTTSVVLENVRHSPLSVRRKRAEKTLEKTPAMLSSEAGAIVGEIDDRLEKPSATQAPLPPQESLWYGSSEIVPRWSHYLV